MSRRPVPGFWRERARGIGFLILLGGAVLAVGALLAGAVLVVLG